MTDIREAVARAIWESTANKTSPKWERASHDAKIQTYYRADAAIAEHIEAIMEPSEAMVRAGLEAMQQEGSATQIWQAILTAMRNEK